MVNNETLNKKAEMHKSLCNELYRTYVAKNHDYGDSFGESFKEFGITSAMVRLSDKWNRLKTLSKQNEKAMVKTESIADTLLDMANYCLMTLIELKSFTYEEVEKDE